MDRGAWWATVHGVAELDTTEQLTHTHFPLNRLCNLVFNENTYKLEVSFSVGIDIYTVS